MNNSTKKTRKSQAPNSIRNLLIDKIINCGESQTKVAGDLHMKRTTVNAIAKKYRLTQCSEKSIVRGHPITKITPEIGSRIERLVELDNGITLARIKENVIAEFNVNISLATISGYLHTLKVTLKRRGLIIERVNDETRLELRKDFATQFLTSADFNDSKNVFVDESGFNLHMRRNYGRCLKGSRVSVVVPTIRGRNVTLLSAINGKGVVHFKILLGNCNGDVFAEFLKELDEKLVVNLNIDDATIFMDNASPHRSLLVKSRMSTLTSKTQYISPYSYMLNPIEFCFSKIKCIVRANLGSMFTDLNPMINFAISQICEEDCEGWYRLIRRKCALAMNKHKFV